MKYRLFILFFLGLFLGQTVVQAQLNRYYFYAKTQKLYERGDYSGAIGAISVFLEYQSEDEIALYLRALCKYQLDDWRGAQLDLDQLLTRKPFMTEALVLRTAVRNQLGEHKAAMVDIRLASELRPNERDIQYMRGVTHFLLEDYTDAIEDFTITLKRDPEHLDARLNRGTAHLLKGDTVAALQDYRQAAQTNPYAAGPHINEARVYYAQQKNELALSTLDKALELSPKSGQALLIKALIEHDLGRKEPAIATITKAMEYAPRSSLAYYNRAIMYAQDGNYKAAIKDYEAAAQISPNNVFIRYNIALVYGEAKRYREAADALSYAIALYPQFARAYNLRSAMRLKLGDKSGARVDYDSAQSIVARYQNTPEKDIEKWSDTSANFSRLIAFENDFTTPSELVIPAFLKDYDELYPLATIRVGQEQNYTEWTPVRRADSVAGAPFFALVVPSDDTARRVDLSLFPPVRDPHAVNLMRSIAWVEAHNYDAAQLLLDSIPKHSPIKPLGRLVSAVAKISQIRFAPPAPMVLSLSGTKSREMPPPADYSAPIGELNALNAEYGENPYLYYSLGIAHYLSRDLHASEEAFNKAIALETNFAEALFNRGLVRILLNKNNQACLDLSLAGQLGLDRAYRVISDHCKR